MNKVSNKSTIRQSSCYIGDIRVFFFYILPDFVNVNVQRLNYILDDRNNYSCSTLRLFENMSCISNEEFSFGIIVLNIK
jgi:hypothetical protein